ncbi:MAG: TrmB family transcriptional regulator [Candidatus Marinimicrobia bacterium]|nr:TrmB family transcriptional regulator [FCB group bacterium]MBL7024670.1 TrmB family transcriptional regulator [Candidatus Neomarinimicrobiota bacterium]
MATSETNLRELTDLGISEREAKLYLVMLEYGEVTANEMHRLTGVQRSKIYSILSRMVVHGLCNERMEGRNRFFTALNPKDVKATLQREWDSEHLNRVEKANGIFDRLEDKFIAGGAGPSLNSVEIIRNAANIHNRYLQLMNEVQEEVLAYVRPPIAATTKATRKVQFEAQQAALDRGVTLRSIFSLEHLGGINQEWEKLSENDLMRVTDSLPIKLFIFDGKRVLAGLPSNSINAANFFMLYVEDEGFCQVLVEAFEEVWKKAIRVEVLSGNNLEGNVNSAN